MSDIPKLTVESIGTRIYFYASIDSDRTLDLIKQLRMIDENLTIERVTRGVPPGFAMVPIWLHIQSYGGGVFEGFNVADTIPTLQSPVYCVIDGVAASAGTIIALACEKRFIRPSGFMMIHQVSSMAWGTYEHIKGETLLLRKIMKRMIDFYASRTSMDRTEIREMLKRDTWFTAKEALAAGMVHEIL